MCALTLPMLLTSSGTVVATEKSKIQEWPFAGVSRGHTVVLCACVADASAGESAGACRVRGEAKFAVKRVKTPKNFPPPAGASGGACGGLRARFARLQKSRFLSPAAPDLRIAQRDHGASAGRLGANATAAPTPSLGPSTPPLATPWRQPEAVRVGAGDPRPPDFPKRLQLFALPFFRICFLGTSRSLLF